MATGVPPSYSGLVFRLAWANTWGLLKDRTRDVIFAIPTMLVGAAIFWLLYGWAEMKHEVITFLAFVLAPGGLFLIFAFLWNLCLASDQLVYDAIKSLSANTAMPVQQPAVALAERKEPPINWNIWKQMPTYKISEFAAILAHREPALPNMTPEQAGFQRLLLQDIEVRKLEYIPEHGVGMDGYRYEKRVTDGTRIVRDIALRWADNKKFDVSHVK